jgi:hypothetical protein
MSTPTHEYEQNSRNSGLGSEIPLGDPASVTLDFSGIDYLTSERMSELLRLRRRLPRAHIVLLAANPLMLRILRAVGFDKLFEVRIPDHAS